MRLTQNTYDFSATDRLGLALFTLLGTLARADAYADAIQVFRQAGESGTFFNRCHGYAVFPNIGKGGMVVGAAHGKGRPAGERAP